MTQARGSVSCICTAYDVEPFVARAVESALAQDYGGDLEIIAVDDGSRDGTGAVLDRYADRVTVVHQRNGGFVSAVNAGLAAARGDYLALLDGDDEWPPDKVRRQAELLDRRPDVGLVFGDMEVVDAEGAVLHESFWQFERIRVSAGDVFARLVHANFTSGGASMLRAAYRDRFAPIPDGVPWPDWYFAVTIGRVSRLERVDGAMNRYRLHGANMGFQVSGPQLARNRRAEIRMRRWILANLSSSRAPVTSLVACYQGIELQACEAAAAAGDLPTDGVPVDGADRALASAARDTAEDRLRAGDVEGAARALLRALGHDPWDERARARLTWLVRTVGVAALAATGWELPDPVEWTELRGFCAVAELGELRRRPVLLSGFARSFGPADDATLVVVGTDESPAALRGATLELLAAAGIDECDLPDVLLLPGLHPGELRGRADVVLTGGESPPGLEGVPRADAVGAAQLGGGPAAVAQAV